MKKRQARLVSVFSAFATEISVFFLWKQTPSKMSGTKNIATQSRGRHVAFSMVFYVHIRCVAKLQVLTEVRCRNHMQQPFHFFSYVFYFFFFCSCCSLFCFVLSCFVFFSRPLSMQYFEYSATRIRLTSYLAATLGMP